MPIDSNLISRTVGDTDVRIAVERILRSMDMERGYVHEWDYLDDPCQLAERRGVVSGVAV